MHQLSRNCPVCGWGTAETYLQKGELRLVRCIECSMIYANPAPREMACGTYYHQVGTEYYLSANKLESDYSPIRFERELCVFRTHSPRGAVLDVGCSSGAFLFQLNQRFPNEYQILGTDVSGAPLDYAESRGVPIRRGNFLEEDFGRRQFDAVCFWAVLEHVLEPKQFVQKAWTLLKPSGLTFILVPNMNSLAVRLLGARYRYIYRQHLNYFTKFTLSKLTEDRFSMVQMRSTHFNPIVLWQDWKHGGEEVSNLERAALLKRTTAYKQNRLLSPVKVVYRLMEQVLGALNLADNLMVVLRKKE